MIGSGFGPCESEGRHSYFPAYSLLRVKILVCGSWENVNFVQFQICVERWLVVGLS